MRLLKWLERCGLWDEIFKISSEPGTDTEIQRSKVLQLLSQLAQLIQQDYKKFDDFEIRSSYGGICEQWRELQSKQVRE